MPSTDASFPLMTSGGNTLGTGYNQILPVGKKKMSEVEALS